MTAFEARASPAGQIGNVAFPPTSDLEVGWIQGGELGKHLLGYARVSTYGQTLDTQLEQLRGAGCTKIYPEKVTGAHSDRRELLKMLNAGEVVTVTRIDRFARSTFDLFAIVKQIVDAEAQFRSLAEPWADTRTSTGRLMIVVLGGLAAAIERRAESRSTAVARAGRNARRTRAQLRREPKHDFAANGVTKTEAPPPYIWFPAWPRNGAAGEVFPSASPRRSASKTVPSPWFLFVRRVKI
jgi:hypothetical protein